MKNEEIEQLVYSLETSLGRLKKRGFWREDNSGLKQSEKFFLFMIKRLNQDGQATSSEIAKRFGITMSAVTHQVNALETQGYLARVASKDDRRIVNINLSQKGILVLEELRKIHQKKVFSLIEYLGEKESREFVALINKVSTFLEEENKEDISK